MSKSLLTSLADAVLNRVSASVANVLLRRLASHAAAAEAMEYAAIEERIATLRKDGQDYAADRLALYLDESKGDDPSYVMSTCFGRQLLADSYEVDTPEMRGEPVDDEAPPVKHRRIKGKLANGRPSESAL